MKRLGKWWNSNSVEIVEMEDGRHIALDGWNGEQYTDCWQVGGENDMDIVKDGMTFKPVYRFQAEELDLDSIEEDSDEWDRAMEVVDFEEC